MLLLGKAEANIVLKLIASNPSKGQTQKVPLKVYLPKETKPEDVVDKGDLDVAYDTQQGSYYVYGEYELKPGETLERDVELKDIWVIPENEIETLRLELIKLEGLLKNTEFAERIAFLKTSIESKLNQIIESQVNSPANPERHISDYRDNLKILESVKTDMALARSLLAQVKSFPTVMVWRLILAIIIFLGILGVSFYFIWHKQLKAIAETAPPKEEEFEEAGPKRHEVEEKTKEHQADIDKILGEEPKEEL
jgi:hypothetical protein